MSDPDGRHGWPVVRGIVRLKWNLLRNGLRGSTQLRLQTVLSVVFSAVAGVVAFALLVGLGRSFSSAGAAVVVVLPVVVVATAFLAAASGVESTVDVRMIASLPLSPSTVSTGVLVGALVGPPALLGAASGFGLAVGYGGGGPVSWLVLALVVAAWWATLVLVSRTAADAVGALATGRWRQVAQFVSAFAAIGLWLVLQVGSQVVRGWNGGRWMDVADVAAWTPPGQLGRALDAVAERPAAALLHLSAAVVWLPLLWWAHQSVTARLATTAPRDGGNRRSSRTSTGVRTGALRWLPAGPVGTLAARTLRIKFRTPREAVNTIVALLLGVGALGALPFIASTDGLVAIDDGRLVLTAGLLHFAVLFEGNNAYGYDGPPLWSEVAAGADGRALSRSKALASVSVITPAALVLVVLLAAVSGGWAWLPAGLLLVLGSILLATAASVLSAAIAPFSLPDSPNPLAAGDAGQGCLAGSVLTAGMVVLTLISLPVALAVFWAASRGPGPTAAVAVAAPLLGGGLLVAALVGADRLLRGREPELVAKVTPAR